MVPPCIAALCTALSKVIPWNILLKYCSNPESKIGLLTEAMEELKTIGNDVNDGATFHGLPGKKRREYVTLLLERVPYIEAKVNRIVQDYERCRCLGGCSINFLCINWKAIRKQARVVDLREKITKLKVLTIRSPPPRVQEMQIRTLLGMESNLEKVLKYLDNGHVGIIGIWGMGGVGKTSLLKLINNSFLGGETSAMFDHVIWAAVSKEYAVNKLQDEICSRLFQKETDERLGTRPLDDNWENAPESEKATAIFNHLKCRNFLLLLDDLWQKVDLEAVGVPIPSKGPTGRYKHKVVFTTRMEKVCGSMEAHEIKINCLEPEDAWNLFREMVGQDTLKSHPGIPRLARQVVEECHGLPLALTVIGKAMSTRKTPNEWQDAITLLRKSKHPEILEKDEDMFPGLKLSYDYLPDDATRKCFLLCALWPEDVFIQKDRLIGCWMGHGLIDVGGFNNIYEAYYDRGHAIIGTLKSSCLLEPGFRDYQVKMHDIIRDMALRIASEGDKKLIVQSGNAFCKSPPADLNVWATAEHVSLIGSEITKFPDAPPNLKCSNLVTLILRRNRSLRLLPSNFFVFFPSLTYLDLSGTPITELPPDISEAQNLQYLNLSSTAIRSLPESLSYRTKLKFLILRFLEDLITPDPRGVTLDLSMLEVLDLFGTRYENWAQLVALARGLKALRISLGTVQEIERLSQLHGVMLETLMIASLLDLRQPHQLLLSNILSSHNMSSSLHSLIILNCETLEELIMERGSEGAGHDGDIVNQNWCLPKLEELSLTRLRELKKISWRGLHPSTYFPTLSVLDVRDCDKLKNGTWVLKLECLQVLQLFNCKEMERLIDDADEADAATVPAFPSLKCIYLTRLPNLTIIRRSQSTFPSLELLDVRNCPALRSLPFSRETRAQKQIKNRG